MRKLLLGIGLFGLLLGSIPTASAFASTPPPNTPSTNGAHTASGKGRVSGAQIVRTAMRYLGYPYTTVGNSPKTGFSCIGFVSYVYRSNGIPVPDDLGGALAFAPRVRFQNLLPGDVLFFQNTIWNGLSHTAIYIGAGRFIHAEWYNRGVVITSFRNDKRDGNYWPAKYLGANRPWNGPAVGAGANSPGGSSNSGATPIRTGPTATVNAPGLNVRSGPSKRDPVRQVVGKGTKVTILGSRNGWYKVQLPDGTIGWVLGKYIGKGAGTLKVKPVGPPAKKPVSQRPVSTATVKTPSLRVRSSPSSSAAVMTNVTAGQTLTVLERKGGWLKVRLPNGTVGWVMSQYTTVQKVSTPSTNSAYVSRRSASKASGRAATVTAGVRVHTRPWKTSPVITVVDAGTHIRVLHVRGRWARVRLPSGVKGFVFASYVS